MRKPKSRKFPAFGLQSYSLALSVDFDFTVAVAAINWSVKAGFKRYLGIFTTLGTRCREHLPRPVAVATVAITLCLPCLTAGGTPFWFIGVASRRKQLLFLRTKGETSSTIGTLDCFVLKTHQITSFLFSWLELRSSDDWINLKGNK